MTLLDTYAPLKRQIKSKFNPWYTSKLADLRKFRDKLRINADKSKLSTDIKLYIKARNDYNTKLSNSKRYYFNEKFTETCTDSRNLWQSVNTLTGYRKSSHVPISKLTDNNTVYDTPQTVCDVLASHFIVNRDKLIPETTLSEYINNYEQQYSAEQAEDIELVTADEVSEAIRSTKKIVVHSFLYH